MEDLIYIYRHVDILLIIMARIIACMVFLPLVMETKMPKMAIAGFSLCIAISVYFRIDVSISYYVPTLLGFTIVLVKEILVGLIIGFTVKVFFQIFSFMGSLISMQGGLSMSTVIDPSTGIQSTSVGRIYELGFATVFLVSGGYHWLIQTLVTSFQDIPISQAVFSTGIVGTMMQMMTTYFELGLKLSLPIMAIILIIDFAMGIMARTVPQMNMFVVGIPLKMIVLFLLMIVTIQTVSEYNQMILEALIHTVTEIIQGMRML